MGKHLAAVCAALIVVGAACAPAAPTPPSTTTTTTRAVVPTTVVAGDDGTLDVADETAAFSALLAAAPQGTEVVVDRPWRIEGTVVVPKAVSVRFEGEGRLVRTIDYVRSARAVLRLGVAASGSHFEGLAISGPVGCSLAWYPWSGTHIAPWSADQESQHAVEIRGARDVSFRSARVSGMSGDGFWIAEGSAGVAVEDAHVSCVRRNAISNTGSSDVTVHGGVFAGTGRWAFNVEPYGSWSVQRYRIVGPTVGSTGWQWFMSEGPGDAFNCSVRDVSVTGADLRGALSGTREPAIAACVADEISISGTRQ